MKYSTLSMLAIAGLMTSTAIAAPATAPFDANQTTAIETIVHNYLIQHPEVLIEASQALQMKQMKMLEDKVMQVIPKIAASLLNDPTSPVAGNPKGTIAVIEFFDYQCPHCKAMASEINNVIAQNSDVKVIYKELPIFGPDSEFASRAALASVKQGKFAAFNEALLKAPGRLSNQTVLDIASKTGLDIKKLQADMQDPAYSKELTANAALANQLNLVGTPAFIVMTTKAGKVNARFVPGQTTAAELNKHINAIK